MRDEVFRYQYRGTQTRLITNYYRKPWSQAKHCTSESDVYLVLLWFDTISLVIINTNTENLYRDETVVSVPRSRVTTRVLSRQQSNRGYACCFLVAVLRAHVVCCSTKFLEACACYPCGTLDEYPPTDIVRPLKGHPDVELG
ncbi:hypothetical protein CBL_11042 [Carabus blaptoides fortunei]